MSGFETSDEKSGSTQINNYKRLTFLQFFSLVTESMSKFIHKWIEIIVFLIRHPKELKLHENVRLPLNHRKLEL